MYQTRPSQQTSPFNQVILADRYSSLINSLGNLHAACVWEEILLQKNIPERWNEAIKSRDCEIAGDEVNDVLAALHADERSNVAENEPGDSGTSPQGNTAVVIDGTADQKLVIPKEAEDRAAFKNARTLGYLLTSLPSSVTGFFHLLGHGLIGKRRIDIYQRQNASMAADAIASAVLRQLQLIAPNKSSCIKDRFSYLIVVLSSFSQLLFECESRIAVCCLRTL
jgi:E3 ubiquitin-protein ligase HUWE1